ncbi:hypothetical protein [Roseofilum sp. SID2]|uniref:hypothetical protein n=1 Tax=Roseofilum sp. SID2 TaxID=2821498 RepID=UPI00298E4FB2|nr:hypothetical protein [Roseofilum sp. SID2]
MTTVPIGASPTDTPFAAQAAFKPAKMATEVAAVMGSAIFLPVSINLLFDFDYAKDFTARLL